MMQGLASNADSSDNDDDLDNKCLAIMAECFPAELSTNQLTKLD